MRKRERENPCFICGHYHKFEDGEVCGTCGHRLPIPAEKSPQHSAFSFEILPFLYLGSYDNASRAELLKAQGITHILNTVPACQNLYKNSFTYYCANDSKVLPFEECIEFIEKVRKENSRVLVHCMSGQSRSPAIVIAYLMRHKSWKLHESYQWVKERKSTVNLSPEFVQQLQQFEMEIFGINNPSTSPLYSSPEFGFVQQNSALSPPLTFASNSGSISFNFGARHTDSKSNSFVFGAVSDKSIEHTMDSS